MSIRSQHQGQHPVTAMKKKAMPKAFTYTLPNEITLPTDTDEGSNMNIVNIDLPLELKCIAVKEFTTTKYGKTRARITLDDDTLVKFDELYNAVYARATEWLGDNTPFTVNKAYYEHAIDVGVRKRKGELEPIMHRYEAAGVQEDRFHTVAEHNKLLKNLQPSVVDTDCNIWISKRDTGFFIGFFFQLNKFEY